ncbi:MAG TPA: P-type conjugative transfer protein TrbG [Hyphomonas sp.]|nr:P-type conjugative transfer protein TrbG [Hyphomonas sp.]HRJ02580.1 P-type conjugative transfer protein TrbG [Hyphomonas sp.]HRK68486.1 P-type conjugative transfer protein TrbG [Hyphomonas sp.]
MTRFRLAAAAALFPAACAGIPPAGGAYPPEVFIAAIASEEAPQRPVEIVETPVAMPLPGQLKPLSPSAKPKPLAPAAAIAEGASAARVEPSPEGYVNAVQVYPYTEGALYQLYASPGQVCDIALQPGERLVSVSAGDTVRWVVGDTVSGSGAAARAHVLVKPIAPGLSTNLMIATDRRTYHLELTSLDKSYMAALSWRYPADEFAGIAQRNERALVREEASITSGLRLQDLNFSYRIDGAKPAWRPVRVFDDGRQVFIQMPDGITAHDAPPLFVLAGGKAELVNYRVKGNYYIVDHLFSAAELRQGSSRQTIVRIQRLKPPAGDRR